MSHLWSGSTRLNLKSSESEHVMNCDCNCNVTELHCICMNCHELNELQYMNQNESMSQ